MMVTTKAKKRRGIFESIRCIVDFQTEKQPEMVT